MLYSLVAPLVLVALAGLKVARADYAPIFVGCVSPSYEPTDYALTNTPQSAEDCARECYALKGGPTEYPPFTYSYYMPPVPIKKRAPSKRAPSGVCRCTNEAAPLSQIVATSTGQSSGTCGDQQFAYWTTASTYAFEQCYDTIDPGNPDARFQASSTLTTPQECLSYCRGFATAFLFVNSDATFMQCYCGDSDTYTNGESYRCGRGAYQRYNHEADSVISSQFARRQLRERLIQARSERSAICPRPLTACRVSSSLNDSFECINTAEELESCGGCIHGLFNEKGSASGGVDCSTVPGIARGGVTCSAGECVAFACRKGWNLLDGTCVKA